MALRYIVWAGNDRDLKYMGCYGIFSYSITEGYEHGKS